MKKKDIKENIGDIRSIKGNLDILYGRLNTIEREGQLPELGQSIWKLMEARELLQNCLQDMENK